MKIVINTILLVELVYSNWRNVMGMKEKYTVGELGLTLPMWVIGRQRYVTIMICDLFQIHTSSFLVCCQMAILVHLVTYFGAMGSGASFCWF